MKHCLKVKKKKGSEMCFFTSSSRYHRMSVQDEYAEGKQSQCSTSKLNNKRSQLLISPLVQDYVYNDKVHY